MYLGITLDKLNDFEAACQAFEKALELQPNDCSIFMNYAIVLHNRGYNQLSKMLFLKSEEIFQKMDDEDKEEEMMDQREKLAESLDINIE